MYEILLSNLGKFWVHKDGWGRPLSDYESALTYAAFMNGGIVNG